MTTRPTVLNLVTIAPSLRDILVPVKKIFAVLRRMLQEILNKYALKLILTKTKVIGSQRYFSEGRSRVCGENI